VRAGSFPTIAEGLLVAFQGALEELLTRSPVDEEDADRIRELRELSLVELFAQCPVKDGWLDDLDRSPWRGSGRDETPTESTE